MSSSPLSTRRNTQVLGRTKVGDAADPEIEERGGGRERNCYTTDFKDNISFRKKSVDDGRGPGRTVSVSQGAGTLGILDKASTAAWM